MSRPMGVADVDEVGQVGQARGDFPALQAIQPPLQRQQLLAGLLVVQGRFLQGGPDTQPHLVRLGHRVIAGDGDGAGGGGQQGYQHPNDGGLAGAVRPQEAIYLAAMHRQVNAIHGLDLGKVAHQVLGDDGFVVRVVVHGRLL